MKDFKTRICFYISVTVLILFLGCTETKKEPLLFEALDSRSTGLDFSNKLTSTKSFNLFDYMYFYNGAGVGAGDFNNDGLVDLFFSSNQGQNKLYLNTGELHFRDVTTEAKIPMDGAWNTGVSIVDINNDGLLDIYVCRVGQYEGLKSQNQLLICQGISKNIPVYVDKSREYGVGFSGFSTQAAFLDYDMDGDLDMFLLNHSVHQNSTFRPRKEFLGTYHPVAGGRMYRNDGTAFIETTRETGINSSAIGYGLGVVVSDINLDGYPDIYIGNDFHENDYLYINQKNGTFKEDLNNHIMHTSRYTMGVDAADANNDGYPEIISMDMLPADPYSLKRSLGEDSYDIFNLKLSYGYNFQYTRNNLQFNRRNGMFSETGLYSGIAATDWSWAPLWMDFDNDGLKDLFISNGIPKRMNDIDYINYISDNEVQQKMNDNKIEEIEKDLIDKFPKIKIHNKFFHNEGGLKFKSIETQVGNNPLTYSNGAVFADFDQDGDLDIVTNNIDDPVYLFENRSAIQSRQSFLELKLKGPSSNVNALGSKAIVFANGGIRTYEKYPVRGFQSSMETSLHVGLRNTEVDSLFLIWPDNSYQRIQLTPGQPVMQLTYSTGLPLFDYRKITGYFPQESIGVRDISGEIDFKHAHKENVFAEFDRDPLIPHMLSTEGPALAVADITHDGLDDVFVGSAKGQKSALFIQNVDGRFIKSAQPVLENDSGYEDVDACWADINKDGHQDLIVASGGNEYYGMEAYRAPRIYLNDGKGKLSGYPQAFRNIFLTGSCIVACDYNNDGAIDLFAGGRAVPKEYGQIPTSYILENDGTGRFKDVTQQVAPDLSHAGFVTDAVWLDLDNDGDRDFVLSFEWGAIEAFINDKGRFSRKSLTDKKGWWNFLLPWDINSDGRIDFVAGNLGLNNRFEVSPSQPVRLYYNDFDDNGTKEQILSYYLDGKEIPFVNKGELEKQIPILKKRFFYAGDFAKATMEKIFTGEKLKSSTILTADYFSNSILVNKGNLQFDVLPLPWEAQLSSYRDAAIVNANNDSLPDLLLVGNYFENNVDIGRYDADFGTVLLNKGNLQFTCERMNGLNLTGQSRRVEKISLKKADAFLIVRNNDSARVVQFGSNPKQN